MKNKLTKKKKKKKKNFFLTVLARVAFRFKARQGRAGSGEAYHGPKALAGSAVKPHKVNFLFLVRCVCV